MSLVRRELAWLVAGGCALLAACAGTPIQENERGMPAPQPSTGSTTQPRPPETTATIPGRKPGGYYLDDGPGANPPADLASIPDAVPRAELVKASTTRPYTAMGKTYTPMREVTPYKARGLASWYGKRYHGKPTSSGEVYDMYQMTAAHPTLPIPSYVRVTSVRNGRSVVVRVNDRGPFHSDRLIDLSYVAAWKLGFVGEGSGLVDVESIVPGTETAVAEPPKAIPVAVTIDESAPSTTTGVFLQLGAFASRENADDFLNKMRVELEALAAPMQVFAKDNLFRVHAGPYADREAAAREAARIDERLGLKPFVVVR
jgi:rare lipoprotein A